jgi:nitrogen fixation protein NifX
MRISERKLHIEPSPQVSEFDLKVAFATLSRQCVDQHFGSAKCVLIYGVNEQEWHVIEAIEYAESAAAAHDKLPTRIGDLAECAAIFCNACGASAIRQLLEKGIHPVKVLEGTGIHELLGGIQDELKSEPTGWLARAIKQKNERRHDEADKAERLSQLMDEEW